MMQHIPTISEMELQLSHVRLENLKNEASYFEKLLDEFLGNINETTFDESYHYLQKAQQSIEDAQKFLQKASFKSDSTDLNEPTLAEKPPKRHKPPKPIS